MDVHANGGCAHAHTARDLIDGQVCLESQDHGGALVRAQLSEGSNEFAGIGGVIRGCVLGRLAVARRP